MQYDKLYSALIADLRETAKQHEQTATTRCGACDADWIVDQQIASTLHRITYRAEMAAGATKPNGTEGTVYWIMSAIKGEDFELDSLDYSTADRFVEA